MYKKEYDYEESERKTSFNRSNELGDCVTNIPCVIGREKFTRHKHE